MNPISNLPSPSSSSTQASDDSAAERARKEELRAQQNAPSKFKAAMTQAGGPAAPVMANATARQTTTTTTGKAKDPKAQTAGAAGEEALSPAMLKLRAAGAQPKTTDTAAKGKAADATTAPAAAGGDQPVPTHSPTKAARYGGESFHPAMLTVLARQSSGGETADISAAADAARRDARMTADGPAVSDVDAGTGAGNAATDRPTESDNAATAATGIAPQPGVPLAQQAVPTPQLAGPAATIPLELLQQVVEYATVAKNTDGFMEFRMGLSQNALGGMKIRVTAYGNRRIGLKIDRGDGDDTVDEGHVQGLIAALKAKNVDVVDVAMG